ncbi:MAG TPA: PAS domain-containing protein [Polyangiaceae bacterium]|nr:PAS domain-containing protein [Polyangiaceae bacterium]
MTAQRGTELEPAEELASLRREVQTLRQRVAELQRQRARTQDPDSSKGAAGLSAVSAREELLVEAERIAHVGSWVWDIETNTVSWSDELFRILGCDPERDHPTAEAFFARVHPEDRERIEQASAAGVASGVAEHVDYRVTRPDGQIRYVGMDAAMLFDADGKLQRMVGTVLDRTEERALQQKMQSSLELLEEAQSIAQMGNWSYDLVSGHCEWSLGMYRMLGIDPSTPASPELYFSRLLPEDQERVKSIHERAVGGDWRAEVECRFARMDGEIRHCRVRTIARSSAGQVREFRGTVVDITDQTQLAQRMAQVGKSEAVARLAGGIAHDFNNLLTVIGANLELWSDQIGADGEIRDASRAVQSARSLTDRLLALGRKAPLAKQVVDTNELVARTVDLLRRVIGDSVQLVLVLGASVPTVCVDPSLIEQALINLVINARDAMPQGGTVTLSTRCLAEPPMVEIAVSDDGPGMPDELKSRIFEPFFTTKGDRGTGLGLSTALATVEQHGGSLEVDSERGRGSCFRLSLPADASQRPASIPPVVEQAKPQEPSREILVVEDEPLVAAVVARSLERKGHRPLLAHRPSEALRLWDTHPDVALVICDVSMAEMRGPELVGLLRQSGRAFRVIYVTGYQAESALDTQGERVLMKPFSPRDLLQAVSESSLAALGPEA